MKEKIGERTTDPFRKRPKTQQTKAGKKRYFVINRHEMDLRERQRKVNFPNLNQCKPGRIFGLFKLKGRTTQITL